MPETAKLKSLDRPAGRLVVVAPAFRKLEGIAEDSADAGCVVPGNGQTATSLGAVIRWCELKQVDAGSAFYNSFRRAIFEMDSLDRHCAQRDVAPKSRLDDVEDDAIAALAR